MVLPVLVAVALGLVWLLVVGVDQLRATDAARESARALARGDSAASAVAAGVRVGPGGTTVSVSVAGGEVTARAQARVDGPGGLFRFLPGVRVHATAVAAAETS